MSTPAPHVELASDSAVLVRFPGEPSLETSARVLALFDRLMRLRENLQLGELHPAYTTLLVEFDPEKAAPAAIAEILKRECEFSETEEISSREVILHVSYGGEDGPDLADVAQLAGLSTDDVIRAHSEATYVVAFLGFSPGFPYLLGLPEALKVPRKSSPRVRVPAGSVALAGVQTGIYPSETPGGWQLIARTDEILFSAERNPPALLRPGYRVRFKPHARTAPVPASSPATALAKGPGVLKIESIGFSVTSQNLGRAGETHLGVSVGGAADPVAHVLGQRLVGNEDTAGSLEVTAFGAVVQFSRDTWFAITGAPCSPELDGQPIAMATALPVSAGQRLVLGRTEKGLRSYLSFRGGAEIAKRWSAGDVVGKTALEKDAPSFRRATDFSKSLFSTEIVLRTTRGPQWDWFSSDAHRRFFTNGFAVTGDVDRLGVRLKGEALELDANFAGRELVSEGLANGAIQIPAGGQPMILFCEQRTTGGYPKIANVIRADLFRVGQLAPGMTIRFEDVSFETAWAIHRDFERSLQGAVHAF